MELSWRALALLLLVAVIGFTLRGRDAGEERVAGASLAGELPRLTREAGGAVHVDFEAAPPAESRAWLAALRHAGSGVRWSSAAALPPLALEVSPRMDPAGGVRAGVASAPRVSVLLGDGAGVLDTVPAGARVATLRLPAFVAPLTARSGAQDARALLLDSLLPRRVLVIGSAGWEGKFVLAALEERGWKASARFHVAPGIDVTQGAVLGLDTARYAAVIVLDSSAAGSAASVAEFVRQGGGLILAGSSARVARFAPLAPGGVGARVRPASLAFADSAPRRALGFAAVTRLKSDAIPLESRDGLVAVAARRAGTGRVVQVGYDETWRWRLAGATNSVEAHRAWWSDLVAGVAYRPAVPLTAEHDAEAAPLAALISTLGPAADREVPAPSSGLPWWIFAVIVASLLAEWASRRLRGAP